MCVKATLSSNQLPYPSLSGPIPGGTISSRLFFHPIPPCSQSRPWFSHAIRAHTQRRVVHSGLAQQDTLLNAYLGLGEWITCTHFPGRSVFGTPVFWTDTKNPRIGALKFQFHWYTELCIMPAVLHSIPPGFSPFPPDLCCSWSAPRMCSGPQCRRAVISSLRLLEGARVVLETGSGESLWDRTLSRKKQKTTKRRMLFFGDTAVAVCKSHIMRGYRYK